MDISLYDYAFPQQSHMVYEKQSKNINYIRDHTSKDRIRINTDENIYRPFDERDSKANYALLIEPRSLKPHLYDNIHQVIQKYDKILTHDKSLIDTGAEFVGLKYNSNPFEFYPFGGCWIPEEMYGIPEKDKDISFIYSDKKLLQGHKLRHAINCVICLERHNVDMYGRGTERPLECKSDALRRYRFSLVIENVRKDWWFTEKLLDCFALGVIPIYWGCPDIGKFFDTDGMIIVKNINEIKQALSGLNLSGEDGEISAAMIYEGKREAIQRNFELFKQYAITDDWLYENILK